MKNKKVLLIGMLDSIHLARWLIQFQDSDFLIDVFPSTHFRKPHRELSKLMGTNIRILGLARFGRMLGYFDSVVTFRFLGGRIGRAFRGFYLRLYIFCKRPTVIHAVEIQHAGYLVSSYIGHAERRIVTNWGSDIYYYQNLVEHQPLIRDSLRWATHYSAECARDYQLARDWGFTGIDLPKIPNAGGMTKSITVDPDIKDRNQLIVKCYGGRFGLGAISISVCLKFLDIFKDAKVFLYSVTPDLQEDVNKLSHLFPNRVRFSTISTPLSHEEILEEFRQSKVYIGLSRSDGLSTSFLEALMEGAYPIQSNTSCANELITLGAVGSVVEPRHDLVLSELLRVYPDQDLIRAARQRNWAVGERFLEYHRIQERARSFYV